jgi:DNA modification methylase
MRPTWCFNCAGSGTTAVAYENTGRRWICIERDEEYAQVAIARITAGCTRPGSHDTQDAEEVGELFDRRKTHV